MTSLGERRRIHGAHFWASRPTLTRQLPGANVLEREAPTELYVRSNARHVSVPARRARDADVPVRALPEVEYGSGVRPKALPGANRRFLILPICAGVAAAMMVGALLASLVSRPKESGMTPVSVARALPAAAAISVAARPHTVAKTDSVVRKTSDGTLGARVETPVQKPERRMGPSGTKVENLGRRSAKAPARAKAATIRAKLATKADRQARRPLPPSCHPPYYYDRSYIKRVKLECL